ncbi:zf-TFIIB domain-containing protein [Ignatzschineria rhizosphaerae]|uniref:Zf-TFIIB domain-containing protein n=1 Tax=Ignatzschineria rhizosphaerae TaxID=2923279 RepID=A0ABY3X886_9GAMM|nr:zf-TFIIB domain-containing protein [Ignatzschineria rhizosphaerae]UNM97267.1 zf-TFIIB domain-containing protein [Ignatzschineria rhizosphaerae]
MKCPICKDVTLVMSSRQNVEIDFCPECRGVWLDRGELDKIIELSIKTEAPQAPLRRDEHHSQGYDRNHDRDRDEHHEHRRDNREYEKREEKPYRKRSFLMDLFD